MYKVHHVGGAMLGKRNTKINKVVVLKALTI